MPYLSRTFAALAARTGLRRVLAAFVFFGFIEFYGWLVVILWAYDAGGAGLAGVAAIVQLVPAALLSPALAGFGDRLPRGTALVLAYTLIAVGAALAWLALALEAGAAWVIAASTVATIAISVARPVHYAALPQLAAGSPAQLVSANGLSSVIDGTFRFVGPVVAGVAFVAVGPATAMAGMAVLSLVPALLCTRLGLPAPDVGQDDEGPLRAALGGVRQLWGDWPAVSLLVVMALDFVLSGALDILGVAWVDQSLGLGEAEAGLLIGSLGLGALAGAFAGAAASHGRRLDRVVVVGAALEGAAFVTVAALGALTPAMVVLALCGFGGAVLLVAGRTLLQRCTDDRVLARVFAVQESVSLVGVAVGAAMAPVLVDVLGPDQAWIPLGIGALLLAAACWPAVRRLDARARFLPAELAALRSVPFVDALPPYDVERLARNGSWRDASPDQVVVRQGEPGSEFFVVASGEVAVTVGDVRRPALLGPGRYFGEVALLRSVPRTATVTAASQTRLFVVRGRDFLAAVTGRADAGDDVGGPRPGRDIVIDYDDLEA